MSLDTIVSILGWVITGAIAGYVASLLLKAQRQGCFINIVLGIIGAFVGALVIRLVFPALLTLFGTGTVAGFFNAMFHAIFGAVIVLVVYELVVPGRQLGVRRERRKGRRD
jgi:uncharacterized membrane protein YeaQ/YmgE (transglycosylase-associated protein family)